MDDILEKVKKVLTENGIPEDVIAYTLSELGEGENQEPANEEQVAEELPVVATEGEGEGESVEELPEPVETPVVDEPAFDVEEIVKRLDQLELDNGELRKANEGLLAEISALKQALTDAKVIEGEPNTSFGGNLPNVEGANQDTDIMANLIRAINK